MDSIFVDAQAPTVSGLRRVPVIGDVVRAAHVVTRPHIIRGYLLLKPGDSCTPLRVAESERILRAQHFIADATIEVVANGRGGVDLEVRTIDEVSMILSGSVAGHQPTVRGVKLGSGNVGGLGVLTSAAWRHQPAYDDRMEIRIADYQFTGRPYVMSFASLRDPLGRDDRAEISYPFRTDLQRLAWRTVIGDSRGHATFSERDSGRLALGFRRAYAEVGGIARLGPPGRLSLIGLSFTTERARPDTVSVRLTDEGIVIDTAAAFAGRFVESRSARINLLLGVRRLRFMRARALDALRGTQDVPLGLQLGTLVGRGVNAFGAASNDLFVASDLYIGLGNPRLTYRLQLQGEGQRALDTKLWTGLVASGRFARHSRVTDSRTRIFAAELSGTSRVVVPHALSLGLPDGGLRGYRYSSTVAARRAIARWDEQKFLGTPFDFGDLGIAAFIDVGQLWQGDMPYGENTRVRASLGASLLLAIPMRSTRMWRLEYAVPLNREPGVSRWELRLSHRDLTSFFWREPMDVDAARARAVPASIYNWP